ncbi:hypothetical protein OH76DRAFT_1405349 [Lentinus brumalis]|uniref:Uncharacterized protein n=1 Tax=Lentinus brumalis TaxID=2498619 RepID=A0A371D6D1_9APHY|nr:hypothetical protein OH76DRAFT_1405349 [Polyporus brumalis]
MCMTSLTCPTVCTSENQSNRLGVASEQTEFRRCTLAFIPPSCPESGPSNDGCHSSHSVPRRTRSQ